MKDICFAKFDFNSDCGTFLDIRPENYVPQFYDFVNISGLARKFGCSQ